MPRMAERIMRRVQHAFGFGRSSTAPDDSGPVQVVQVKINDLQTVDGLPVVHSFGFSSSAPEGSSVVRVSVAGDGSGGVIIAMVNQDARPRGLMVGQSVQYDASGSQVLCANDGTILAFAPGETLRKLVTDVFVELFNAHTHPGNGQPPTQKMTPVHLTGGLRGGGP